MPGPWHDFSSRPTRAHRYRVHGSSQHQAKACPQNHPGPWPDNSSRPKRAHRSWRTLQTWRVNAAILPEQVPGRRPRLKANVRAKDPANNSHTTAQAQGGRQAGRQAQLSPPSPPWHAHADDPKLSHATGPGAGRIDRQAESKAFASFVLLARTLRTTSFEIAAEY